ncbi:MAG: AbrB/MazE/SpoVT family DNA-binding domain-containing protein [Candidatus Methanomethylophilaceae archaeon]
METAKVTSKGQITIPIDIRRELGLSQGDRLAFLRYEDRYIILNEKNIDYGALFIDPSKEHMLK